MRVRPAPLVALLALVIIALAAAPSAGAAPRGFDGLQAWSTPSDGELIRMRQGGAGTYRFTMLWTVVEFKRGVRNWGPYDQEVASAARAGLRMLARAAGLSALCGLEVPAPTLLASEQARLCSLRA